VYDFRGYSHHVAVFFYWSGQDFDFGNYIALASASLHAPDGVVLLVDERPVDNRWFDRVAGLPDVVVQPLVLHELMSDDHADLYRRMTFVAHRSDLVRFCALARYGGIYLDTDTITMRSLANVGPRLLLDDGKIVHIGTLALAAGDPLAERMLDSLLSMPDSDLAVYQSVVYRWTPIARANADSRDFGDLAEFFPVHWKDWETIFRQGAFTGDAGRIHVLHHYGYFSRRYTAEMDEHWIAGRPCLFSTLATAVMEAVAA
jgi:hypothetical protein